MFTPASRRGKASFTITPEALKRGYVKVTYDGYNRFIKLDSNDNDNYDLTFHPEGGYLIPDTECVLAFKAIGKDGKGVPVYGKIINSNGTEIKQFTTLHAGMGRVNFTPKKARLIKQPRQMAKNSHCLNLMNWQRYYKLNTSLMTQFP